MKRSTIVGVGVLLAMSVAWAAFGQARGGGRGGFGAMREAQQKAMADLQEQLGKLRAMTERAGQAMQGRNFQDMSEEERAKMREEFTQRAAEQRQIFAAMQQDIDQLKGARVLMTEHEEAMAPLKEALAAAQRENAKATAQILEQTIAQRQRQFEDKITAMGYTMEQMQRMGQRRQRQQ